MRQYEKNDIEISAWFDGDTVVGLRFCPTGSGSMGKRTTEDLLRKLVIGRIWGPPFRHDGDTCLCSEDGGRITIIDSVSLGGVIEIFGTTPSYYLGYDSRQDVLENKELFAKSIVDADRAARSGDTSDF